MFNIKKKRKDAIRATLSEQLEQLEADSFPEDEKILWPWNYKDKKLDTYYSDLLAPDELKRWREQEVKWNATTRFPSELERLKASLWSYRKAEDADARISSLTELINCFRGSHDLNIRPLEESLGLTLPDAKRMLAETVQSRYEELAADRDNPESFHRLENLVSSSRIQYRYGYTFSDLYAVGIEDLPFTDDWNDLVALHHDTPPHWQFVGLGDMGRQNVLLLGGQALEEDSLTKAQIVLAYCQVERYRQHVGDELTAGLVRLVARHKAALGRSSAEK